MISVPVGETLPEQNPTRECGVPLCSVIRVLDFLSCQNRKVWAENPHET